MAITKEQGEKTSGTTEVVPFFNAEETWFWFIQAQAAKNEGARFVAGQGSVSRPCEPLDILNIAQRLYRNRRLLMDHLRVLKYYGTRLMAPDPHRVREVRSHTIWCEAMERLEEVFITKGIVDPHHNVHYMEAAE